MDTDQVLSHAEAHGEAVVRGDREGIFGDFAPDVRERFREAGPPPGLPQVVDSAKASVEETLDDHAVVAIAYTGEGRDVTIRTRWEDRGDRPYITEILSVDG
jgi:hypothetical protein